MQVHVVTIGLVTINPATNERVDKASAINDLMRTETGHRIFPNPAVPNSSGYPTLEQYLILEAASSYKLQHLDQTTVITYNG